MRNFDDVVFLTVKTHVFVQQYFYYKKVSERKCEVCLSVSSRVVPWQGGAVRARSILLSAVPPSVI